MFLLLFATLSILFCRSYLPGYVHFSNDGPFGRISSACHRLPARFTGCWEDLNSIGFRGEAGVPNFTFGFQYFLRPEGFAKFQPMISLLIAGLAVWCFLKESGLAWPACLLGGLAATLNSCFFSNACWGVTAHPITIAMSFLAMAALMDTTSKRRWLRVVLAGLAVGMGVSEGDDVGALFSILVAAFVMWQACAADGARLKNITVGALKVTLVAICAGWLAAQAVSELVATNIKGVHGAQQDEQTKEQRWDWATQWSMPKPEALGFIVPGLFGYRMASPDGGAYWGAVGQDAQWQKYFDSGNQGSPPAKGFKRYSGGGYYAGVLVVLVTFWAALQAFRRKDSAFSLGQRRLLWFWIVIATLSILFALGRWAPFYRLLYALPYFSTMRNPVKFIYFVSCALVVLFAYGIDGLWRLYMQAGPAGNGVRPAAFKNWWAKASKFEKGWVRGSAVALGISIIGWAVYANCREKLEAYLVKVQFSDTVAHSIADFSIMQVGWFVLFLALASAAMLWVFKGNFAGVRARQGLVVLGLLLAVDLGRANLPWIVYWSLDDKYATNPVIDFLRDKPYEHRVVLAPFSPTGPTATRNNTLLSQIYKVEWLQHQLPYLNIQSLDNVQMPRKSEALYAYERAFAPTNKADIASDVTRRWQLTNSRYVFGVVGVEDYVNHQISASGNQLRIVQRFKLLPKADATGPVRIEDLTAVTADDGPLALYEFTGALPRVKLYSNWQIQTNDAETLKTLVESTFNPEQTVLVSDNIPASKASVAGENPGTAEIVSYAPKDVVIKADARVTSILLLNDRYDPGWSVRVDGRPVDLLHCNDLMRGVSLAPGSHTVEFHFSVPCRLFYVSLSAVIAGFALLAFVFVPAARTSDPIFVPPVGATSAPAQRASAKDRQSPGKSGRKLASNARR